MFVALVDDIMLDLHLPTRSLLTETDRLSEPSFIHWLVSGQVCLPVRGEHVGQLEAVRGERLRRKVQSWRVHVHVESWIHGS